jgi:DNA-binding MarR family transcriptional regulator
VSSVVSIFIWHDIEERSSTEMTVHIDEKTAARILLGALRTLADEFEASDVPMHQASVLLAVALEGDRNNGLEVSDVSEIVGLSGAATSRNLAALGEWHRLQKPGLKLIDVKPRLEDRRRKRVELTEDGHKLVRQLREVIQAELNRRTSMIPTN